MKIALLGKGKTGSKVAQLYPDCTIFSSTNKPTLETLSGHDIIISFLPADAFNEYLDLFIASKIPVVTGTTGFNWPVNFDQILKENKLTWVRANNFSLGMTIVKQMIEKMSSLGKLFDDGEFTIKDIHHVHKLDSPSGTALSWKEWLGQSAVINSEREGDVIGYHQMTFDSPTEKISLIHEAKDRSIFANGAIWAAKLIHQGKVSKMGLHSFNDIVSAQL